MPVQKKKAHRAVGFAVNHHAEVPNSPPTTQNNRLAPSASAATEIATDLTSITDDVFTSEEFVFKVVVVGSFHVGKTCLIHRLLQCAATTTLSAGWNTTEEGEGAPSSACGFAALPSTQPTIGTDFHSCEISAVLPHVIIRMQLWDTAGLERYAALPAATYRGASLVLCVFDVTDLQSFNEVSARFMPQLAAGLPHAEAEQIVVVANKMDLLSSASGSAHTPDRVRRQRYVHPSSAFAPLPDAEEELDVEHDDDEEDEASLEHKKEEGKGDAAKESTKDPKKRRSKTHQQNDPLEEINLNAGVVTREVVEAELLSAFPSIHYAEVSAESGAGVRELLQRICGILLERESTIVLPDEVEAAIQQHRSSRLPSRQAATAGQSPTPTPPLTVAASELVVTLEEEVESVDTGAPPPSSHPKTEGKPAARSKTTEGVTAPLPGERTGSSWRGSSLVGLQNSEADAAALLIGEFSPVEMDYYDDERANAEEEARHQAGLPSAVEETEGIDFYNDLLQETGPRSAVDAILRGKRSLSAGVGAVPPGPGAETGAANAPNLKEEINEEEAREEFHDNIHSKYDEIEQRAKEKRIARQGARKKGGSTPADSATAPPVDIAEHYLREAAAKKQQKEQKKKGCAC